MSGMLALISEPQDDIELRSGLARSADILYGESKRVTLRKEHKYDDVTKLKVDFDRHLVERLEHFSAVDKKQEQETGEVDHFTGHCPLFHENGQRNWDWMGDRIASIDFSHVVDTDDGRRYVGEVAWEEVFEELRKLHHPFLWGCLQAISLQVPAPVTFRLFKELRKVSRLEVKSYEQLAEAIMEGSKFPLVTALKLAAFTQELAGERISDEQEYLDLAEKFCDVAFKVLNETEDDHLAAMACMIPSDFNGASALDVAMEERLISFIAKSRVVRIMNSMWSSPRMMDPQMKIGQMAGSITQLIWRSAPNFYTLPVGKFYVEAILFIVYLAVFCFVTIQRYNLYSHIGNLEWFFWACNAGFLLQEVTQIWVKRAEYFYNQGELDLNNVFMMLICGVLTLLFVIRISAVDDCSPQCGDESAGSAAGLDCVITNPVPDGPKYECDIQPDGTSLQRGPKIIYYRFLWSLVSILTWIRAGGFLYIHPTFGPMMRILSKCFVDVITFLKLFMVLWFSFGFAFFYYVGDTIVEYQSLVDVGLTGAIPELFKAALGEFDLLSFSVDQSKPRSEIKFRLDGCKIDMNFTSKSPQKGVIIETSDVFEEIGLSDQNIGALVNMFCGRSGGVGPQGGIKCEGNATQPCQIAQMLTEDEVQSAALSDYAWDTSEDATAKTVTWEIESAGVLTEYVRFIRQLNPDSNVNIPPGYGRGLGYWRSNISQLAMVVYAVMSMLVLFNILIAMMGVTFEEVSANSKLEYTFLTAENTYRLARKSAIISPPLNIVAYGFWAVWFCLYFFGIVVEEVLSGGANIWMLGSRILDGPLDLWYCSYCQQDNPERSSADLIGEWLEGFTKTGGQPPEANDAAQIVMSDAIICQRCFMPQRKVAYGGVVLEIISYNIALVTVIPLLFVTTCIPAGVNYLVTSFAGGDDALHGSFDLGEVVDNYKTIEVSSGNPIVGKVIADMEGIDTAVIFDRVEQISKISLKLQRTAERIVRVDQKKS